MKGSIFINVTERKGQIHVIDLDDDEVLKVLQKVLSHKVENYSKRKKQDGEE